MSLSHTMRALALSSSRRSLASVCMAARRPFGSTAQCLARNSDTPELTAEEKQKEADRLFKTIFGVDNEEETASETKPQEDEEEGEQKAKVNSLFASIFGTRKSKTALKDLQYTRWYPSTVRQWVEDAKTPQGYYDSTGYWVPVGQQFQYAFSEPTEPQEPTSPIEKRQIFVGKGRLRMERKMYPPQPKVLLEADLHGKYRFGIEAHEVEGFPEQLKKVLSFVYANNYEINEFRRDLAIHKWRKKPGDTGSAQVQIAVLTERIRYLTEHTATHKKDISSRRGLQKAVTRRKAQLLYLKKRDVVTYMNLIKDLNLRED